MWERNIPFMLQAILKWVSSYLWPKASRCKTLWRKLKVSLVIQTTKSITLPPHPPASFLKEKTESTT